jgi:hypothetical protein
MTRLPRLHSTLARMVADGVRGVTANPTALAAKARQLARR